MGKTGSRPALCRPLTFRHRRRTCHPRSTRSIRSIRQRPAAAWTASVGHAAAVACNDRTRRKTAVAAV
jgi:hypothetical protein